MSLVVKNDVQIKVGTTTGLVTGASSFTFNGIAGTPDWRGYDIVISELNGRGILEEYADFSWDIANGVFTLLFPVDIFPLNQVYNVHFEIPNVVIPIYPYYTPLINNTFFIRNITIPNISGSNAAILERLNSFIAKYEPECLKLILGYSTWKVLTTETSQRVANLIYGVEYVDSEGKVAFWQGLVHDTDISLIANYIYWYFQEASATQTTGVSTSVSKADSGTSVSPADKMVHAWNFFSSETSDMCSFLWMKRDIFGIREYPEFSASQFCKTKDLTRPTNIFGI